MKNLTRRDLLAGSAAVLAAPAVVRAQGAALKVGVLLPRSGYQASIGQDCFRGVELAGPILKDLGLPDLQIMNADALLVVSRINDAILLTREMVKQRWTPQGVLSMGPGWYEDQYLKTLGKIADGPLSFVPWYDPNKKVSKALATALEKKYPNLDM